MQPELIKQGLIVLDIFLTSNLIAYGIYCFKGIDKDDKIEIMSVRSELRKIEKMNKADRESFL